MSYLTKPKSTGFRELGPQEIELVSGGLLAHWLAAQAALDTLTQNEIVVSAGSTSAGVSFSFGLAGGGGGFAGGGGGGGAPFLRVEIEPEPEDLDEDGEPGITVTLPPIKTIETPDGKFYVRLFADGPLGGGEYIRYEPEFFNWFFGKFIVGYEPAEGGTFTVSYNQPVGSVGLPAAASIALPSVSYSFNPDQHQP